MRPFSFTADAETKTNLLQLPEDDGEVSPSCVKSAPVSWWMLTNGRGKLAGAVSEVSPLSSLPQMDLKRNVIVIVIPSSEDLHEISMWHSGTQARVMQDSIGWRPT